MYAPGQRVLSHQLLRPEPTRRERWRGLAGLYRVPEVEQNCRDGYPSQATDIAAHQLETIHSHAQEAHLVRFGTWAPSLERLQATGLLPPWPDDPWGRAFVVRGSQDVVDRIELPLIPPPLGDRNRAA